MDSLLYLNELCMSNDDVKILTPILLATIAALVAIRLTFRNAANARAAMFSPAVFAICGALIGISIGMIWLSDREGRVEIGYGFLMVFCGASLGFMLGAVAKNVYSKLNRGKATAFVLVTMLLGGSIGAPIGWLVGEIKDGPFEEFRTSGMVRGTTIGSLVGLLLGLSEVLFRRRGTT